MPIVYLPLFLGMTWSRLLFTQQLCCRLQSEERTANFDVFEVLIASTSFKTLLLPPGFCKPLNGHLSCYRKEKKND